MTSFFWEQIVKKSDKVFLDLVINPSK